jgi:AraC-like DNA-binding protein
MKAPMSRQLSELLRSMELHGTTYYRFEGASPFGVLTPPAAGVLCFHIVLEGSVVVQVVGGEPVAIDAGEVMLLSRARAHTLMDRPGRAALPEEELKRQNGFVQGDAFRLGTAPFSAVMLCGEFRFEDQVHPVFDALPSLLHLQAADAQIAALTVSLVKLETGLDQLGREAVLDRLSEVLLIQILRDWLAARLEPGLLEAYSDPQLGRIVAAIQADPGTNWTVAGLARAAGMSRSAFAKHFRDRVGSSPMEFVRTWRLRTARAALRKPTATLEEISAQVGYQSQAAFTKAFRRAYGISPGAFRKSAGEQHD